MAKHGMMEQEVITQQEISCHIMSVSDNLPGVLTLGDLPN